MGVFIYPCKIKEKVSGLVSNEEMDALYEKYDTLKEEIIVLENTSKYDDFVSPFEEGVYTYETESGHADVDISYGTYGDFIQQLECLEQDMDCYHGFQTTISASGIDNCISYKVAEEMLKEFKEYENCAESHFVKSDDDEYGMFLWDVYRAYMEVLQECIELKGIVRYH